MASSTPKALLAIRYENAAQEYLRSLPLEHFMEAVPQATQREITLESLALVRARRPEVHVFNELLVQWERPGQRRPGQVCPDNMVVLSDKPIRAVSSYNLPLEHARPFWMLEYVSPNNQRKDYEENFAIYERELKVPYYLVFYPDHQELTLYRHQAGKYVSVKPNRRGRYAIRKLGLELALHDGWVRFWYEGELLDLPAEMQRELDLARRRAEAERQRAEAERQRAEAERQRAETEQQRAEVQRQRAETAQQRALAAQQHADELQRRLDAAQRELAELRNHGRPGPRRNNGTRRDK